MLPQGSYINLGYQVVTNFTNRFTNLNSKKCKKVKFSTFTQHFVSYYDLCSLVDMISAFISNGFAGSANHYIAKEGDVDKGIRKAAEFVFNVERQGLPDTLLF